TPLRIRGIQGKWQTGMPPMDGKKRTGVREPQPSYCTDVPSPAARTFNDDFAAACHLAWGAPALTKQGRFEALLRLVTKYFTRTLPVRVSGMALAAIACLCRGGRLKWSL